MHEAVNVQQTPLDAGNYFDSRFVSGKAKTPQNFHSAGFLNLAERVRFELTVPLKVHWISSPAHSTTLPPFRVFQLAVTTLPRSVLRQIQAGRCLGEKDYRTAELLFQAPRQKFFNGAWRPAALESGSRQFQPFHTAEVRPQRRRHGNRTIRVLEVFQHRHERTAHGQT